MHKFTHTRQSWNIPSCSVSPYIPFYRAGIAAWTLMKSQRKWKYSTSVRLNLEVRIKMPFIVHRQTSSEKYGIFSHGIKTHYDTLTHIHTPSKITKLKIIFQEIYRSFFLTMLVPTQWQYMPNRSLTIQIPPSCFCLLFFKKRNILKLQSQQKSKQSYMSYWVYF